MTACCPRSARAPMRSKPHRSGKPQFITRGAILFGKFNVVFESEVNRDLVHRDGLAEQWSQTDYPPLERTQYRAAPAVARGLLQRVAGDPEQEAVGKVLGKGEIGMEFVATI